MAPAGALATNGVFVIKATRCIVFFEPLKWWVTPPKRPKFDELAQPRRLHVARVARVVRALARRARRAARRGRR